MTALQEYLVRRLSTSDFLFWVGINSARDQMTRTLLATDPGLLKPRSARGATPGPSHPRGSDAGLPALDGHTQRRPTGGTSCSDGLQQDLGSNALISADDDRFGTAATARDIAAAVPGARLVVYPSGGHLLIGHDEEVSREIAGFVARVAVEGDAR